MRKNIWTLPVKVTIVGVLSVIAVVMLVGCNHADGSLSPKMLVTILDERSKPVEGLNVLFIEEILKETFEREQSKYIEKFRNSARFDITDSNGKAFLTAKYATITSFCKILGIYFPFRTRLIDNAVIVVFGDNNHSKYYLIDSAKYRGDIINGKVNVTIRID